MKLSEKYKFVVNEFYDINYKEKLIAICISDLETGLRVPHPITEFITIKYHYSGKSINSQIGPARIICRFVNYIYERIDNKDDLFTPLFLSGLGNLNLYHGSNYLTHLTNKGLSRNTVKLYENVLTQFFIYLSENNYIKTNINIQYSSFNNIKTAKSLFRKSYLQTKFPPISKANKTRKLKDFGKNRYELITLFIQTARTVAPEIAIGICFQFYGGLRRGELVNITNSDLKITPYESMIVNVKDNRALLFPHLKDTTNEMPKRVNYLSPKLCDQIIIDVPLVWEVYFQHLKYLSSIKKNDNNAFFFNKDGYAMSGKVYERRFKKVKKEFLNKLIDSDFYSDYILLNESVWGTHIGRGIFSNTLFDMKLTPTQIAIARGDTNTDSAMEYVDEKTTIQAIKDNLPFITKLSEIN